MDQESTANTPLRNLRIIVTRAGSQAENLAMSLRTLGADVVVLPVIEIAPPSDIHPLQAAARNANNYNWIIFTSANAVRAFAAERTESPAYLHASIAVVGSATKAAATELGFEVSLTPRKYVAESLLEAFTGVDLVGQSFLLPRAAVARDVVPDELRQRGARVDIVEAYRTVAPADLPTTLKEVFATQAPDWVLFASSSAVDNLVAACGPSALSATHIGSIGPITSATVRKYGLVVAAEADSHNAEGLVSAVLRAHTGA